MTPGGNGKHPMRHVKLFVAGDEPNSVAALQNFRHLRETACDCEIEYEVVDVLQHYREALEYKVLVTPCLVLIDPSPPVMIVGTLKETTKVRAALRLPPAPTDGSNG